MTHALQMPVRLFEVQGYLCHLFLQPVKHGMGLFCQTMPFKRLFEGERQRFPRYRFLRHLRGAFAQRGKGRVRVRGVVQDQTGGSRNVFKDSPNQSEAVAQRPAHIRHKHVNRTAFQEEKCLFRVRHPLNFIDAAGQHPGDFRFVVTIIQP
ncbi:MAG: hypothetical protein BWY09_01113 [Candidatus Hydrogenedentes bacterium ADurb.Bin179]|nr:MAG: hypothetical protein BWY09_01113 [Candidatus Hydrogenedentes bacterium ADurb.Bin179]